MEKPTKRLLTCGGGGKSTSIGRLLLKRTVSPTAWGQLINQVAFGAVRMTYFGLFFFLLVFFMLTYPTGDDWSRVQWAALQKSRGTFSQWILSSLNSYNLNGRVLGNAGGYLAQFSFEINACVRALTTLGIVWLIARLSRIRASFALPLITLLVLVPSVSILKQAMIWSVGFYIYTVPVLLILAIAVLMRDAKGPWKNFLVLVLSFASSLFVETVSVALLAASITAVAISVSRQTVDISYFSLLVGSGIGSVLMFSSPGYRRIVDGESRYHGVAGLGGDFWPSLFNGIGERLPALAQGLVLNLSSLYALGAAIIIFSCRSQRRSFAFGTLAGTASALALVGSLDGLGVTRPGGTQILWGFFTLVLYFAYQIAALILLSKSSEKFHHFAWPWLAGGGLIAAPLLLVSPFGPRNFFISAVFTVIAISIVAAPLINNYEARKDIAVKIFTASAILASVLLGAIGANKIVAISNLQLASELYLNGATRIEVRSFPFPSLAQDGQNPTKFWRQLQSLECSGATCLPLRHIEIVFK